MADRRIKRRRLKRRRVLAKKAAYLAICIILLGFLIPKLAVMPVDAHSKEPVYKYYTSIRIKSGDTLTSIARQYYTLDFSSLADYIREVRFINHLDSDRIVAGKRLIVPYYSTELKL